MGTNPSLAIVNTTLPVNARRWNILNFDTDGSLYFQTQSDAGAFVANVLALDRTGMVTVSNLTANGLYPQIHVVSDNGVALIQFEDTTGPVDAKKNRIWGSQGSINFDVLNDAATAVLQTPLRVLHAGGINVTGGIVVASGGITISAGAITAAVGGNNLADLTCGATNFTVGITVTGAQVSTFAGPIYSATYIYNAGVLYPGQITNGQPQTTWYLASHSSYGLYSNTGLYLAGGLNVAGPIYGFNPPRVWAGGAAQGVYPDLNVADMWTVDQLNVGTTFVNPVNGTDGASLIIRFRDQGGAVPIYWQSAYYSCCATPLPSATVAPAKTTWCAFRYNAFYGLWMMLSAVTEP
jgi:hypothetical protein